MEHQGHQGLIISHQKQQSKNNKICPLREMDISSIRSYGCNWKGDMFNEEGWIHSQLGFQKECLIF